jgi:hypothetical protein
MAHIAGGKKMQMDRRGNYSFYGVLIPPDREPSIDEEGVFGGGRLRYLMSRLRLQRIGMAIPISAAERR